MVVKPNAMIYSVFAIETTSEVRADISNRIPIATLIAPNLLSNILGTSYMISADAAFREVDQLLLINITILRGFNKKDHPIKFSHKIVSQYKSTVILRNKKGPKL